MIINTERKFVTTKGIFEKALLEKYAIGAFNVNNLELIQAVVEASEETKSPLILQISQGAKKYINNNYLLKLAQGALLSSTIPLVLHLDHGENFDVCKECIDLGFSSVMIDGSHHPYEKNVELTRQVVEYAHKHDVTVEGELGVLAGIEDDVVAAHSTYTQPEEVVDFVSKTGVDCLLAHEGSTVCHTIQHRLHRRSTMRRHSSHKQAVNVVKLPLNAVAPRFAQRLMHRRNTLELAGRNFGGFDANARLKGADINVFRNHTDRSSNRGA